MLFRRGTKAVASIENTSSPRWLVPVWRPSRIPHSGRLEEERIDKTSVAKLIVSPASTGLTQRNSRNPGDGPQIAILLAARHGLSGETLAIGYQELHARRPDVPARRGKSSEQRLAPLLFVEVKALRIELGREFLDALGSKA